MEYKDRNTGLISFGIVWILIGFLTGLMALLTVASAASAPAGTAAMPMRMALGLMVMYLGIAVCFVTLGFGSTMARRSARALILVLSWMWLITGLISIVVVLWMLPKMFATMPREQAAAMPVAMACVTVFFGIFFVVLPGLAILFYKSPDTKATVEARDPVHRWTDDVPLPLLAYGVWMISGAASLLMAGLMYTSLPLGPWMLRGFAVPAVMAAFATVLFFVGIGSMRRKPAAWWAAIVLFVVGMGWGLTFIGRTDLTAWYREMGTPMDPRQTQMIEAMYSSPFFIGWLIVFWGAYLAFLIYLRRYFKPAAESHVA